MSGREERRTAYDHHELEEVGEEAEGVLRAKGSAVGSEERKRDEARLLLREQVVVAVVVVGEVPQKELSTKAS